MKAKKAFGEILLIYLGGDLSWAGYGFDEVCQIFKSEFSVYLNINSKNDALLNIKYDNEFIRWYCKRILKNDI
jgi:hypothetical protein